MQRPVRTYYNPISRANEMNCSLNRGYGSGDMFRTASTILVSSRALLTVRVGTELETTSSTVSQLSQVQTKIVAGMSSVENWSLNWLGVFQKPVVE